MGLSWNIEDCDRLESEKVYDEQLGKDVIKDEFWPVVEAAIWGMMTTGVGWKLTDENAAKYYSRYSIAANLFGGYDPISMEDVYKMVGLNTNTAPETDAAWRKRIMNAELDNRARRYTAFVAEKNAATEGQPK